MTLQQKTICLLLRNEVDEGLGRDAYDFFSSCRQLNVGRRTKFQGDRHVAPIEGAGDVRVSLHVCGVLTSGSHMWF